MTARPEALTPGKGLGGWRLAVLALAAAATLACDERLTQPGECPELCPGGNPPVFEEVLEAIPNLDSTFTGYYGKTETGVLFVSKGVPAPADTNIAVVAFGVRPDSVRFRDTLRAYMIDSVLLSVTLAGRDSLVRPLEVLLYKLPGTLDTTNVTYGAVAPFLADPNRLITGLRVPDTLYDGTVDTLLTGAALDRVRLDASDQGRLVLGISVAAATPTGVRIATGATAGAPQFITYVTPIVANPGATVVPVFPEFNTYVSPVSFTPDPDLLTVGGVPSSRALIRFPWPAHLRDSASIVRATLELTSAAPAIGLPNDPGQLDANALVVDIGAKSPACAVGTLCAGVPITRAARLPLPAGMGGLVSIEVVDQVRPWQGSPATGTRAPPSLLLAIAPEAATFTQGVFHSTRSGAPPRLRITYLRTFPFERP